MFKDHACQIIQNLFAQKVNVIGASSVKEVLQSTEHYYKEHTDLHAYTCSKCNQGFHHHTQYNPHIKMCQGIEEEDCK